MQMSFLLLYEQATLGRHEGPSWSNSELWLRIYAEHVTCHKACPGQLQSAMQVRNLEDFCKS